MGLDFGREDFSPKQGSDPIDFPLEASGFVADPCRNDFDLVQCRDRKKYSLLQ